MAKEPVGRLLGYVSWATLISMLAIISCCHIHYMRRQPDLLLSTSRIIRATMLRHNELSTSLKASSLNRQQLEEAADPAAEEESDDEAGQEYSYSADPLTFMARKQLGTVFSAGDPVLNANVAVKVTKPCVLNGNCWTEDDAKYLDWRALKQETLGQSVDQQMESQFKKMQLLLEKAAKACEEGFGEDKESAEACTAKESRRICNRYETLAHNCAESIAARNNTFDGTHYFHEAFLLQSCDGDARKSVEETCKTHEKLPGVNVWHWPGFDNDVE
uniref:Uncharacterized protein n=1 Tax=Cryptomonas curvata TaxID=233186 RepID=A0A6T8BFL6_9CRYP|mmetsp:Transcript_50300/g.104966  ORF Transcript_50300/g.104966 Transcript_50300/m.104966 type:complete len:274 (+) Transcript_50300:1-822(+)